MHTYIHTYIHSYIHTYKVSALDCIPVMVLKSCEPELSDILAELLNKKKCLIESRLPDCWNV